MSRHAPTERVGAPAEPSADDLVHRAMEVLDANWLGHATRPSPRLYPHQWSWDAGFAAIAYAHFDQERAETELRSLFSGQWSNGLLPHIVFAEGAAPYFPGPDFWQTERSPDAPGRPQTSGIVQPPIHATAAWRVYRHARSPERASAFLAELLPKLAAWHGYLHRERTRGDDGLVEIWHPWESGMDNSPLWDDALARIAIPSGQARSYRRTDLDVGEVSERPTHDEYDRYAFLVALFREHRYDPGRIREACPFVLRSVLFNSLLVQADRDLAEIARAVDADPAPFEAWAEQTAAGLETLWDEEAGSYRDDDVRAGERVRAPVPTGFAPLYAGVPGPERARRAVERLLASGVSVDEGVWAFPSLSPEDPRFRPTLYWRGPVWPVVNWVLSRGLARYGFVAEAQRVERALIELARRGGFREHYDPTTGRGHGGEQFAWTAAIVLDLLLGRSGTGREDR